MLPWNAWLINLSFYLKVRTYEPPKVEAQGIGVTSQLPLKIRHPERSEGSPKAGSIPVSGDLSLRSR